MTITDINISEQLQTDAPSIKYTGNEGPQASPQHQQEQMIAQQIWEALSPEQQGQFQSFEQFFQSGIWKQILQQMQADEGQAQGPGPQAGIGSLGPRNMEQQMPTPNRMGARFGGDMEELSMRETIDTPEGIETIQDTETMKMAGGGERGWKAQLLADDWAWERHGKEFYDLSQIQQIELYSEALDFIDSGGE